MARLDLRAAAPPRVARAADMRQSHLTYYFPTQSTLIEAIAERVVPQTDFSPN